MSLQRTHGNISRSNFSPLVGALMLPMHPAAFASVCNHQASFLHLFQMLRGHAVLGPSPIIFCFYDILHQITFFLSSLRGFVCFQLYFFQNFPPSFSVTSKPPILPFERKRSYSNRSQNTYIRAVSPSPPGVPQSKGITNRLK